MTTISANDLMKKMANGYDTANADKAKLDSPQLGHQELQKEDFIKLLLKEVTSQSPLKPYESAQMLQQMAQLSSLSSTESLTKTVKELSADLKQNQVDFTKTVSKNQLLNASQLIGKNVLLPSEVSPLIKTEGLKGSVVLTGPVDGMKVTIADKDGNVMKTFDYGKTNAGVVDFNWDGVDGNNKLMPEGFYQMQATAMKEGKEVQLITAGAFKVDSVTRDPNNSAVIFNVQGLGGVPMDDIIKYM